MNPVIRDLITKHIESLFIPEFCSIHQCFELLNLHMLCVFMVLVCAVKGNTNLNVLRTLPLFDFSFILPFLTSSMGMF